MLPANLELLYSAESISKKVSDLASDIDHWAKDGLVGLCVLRGGVHFYSDLLRALSNSVEHAFCRASSYSSENNMRVGTAVNFEIEPGLVRERSVLIVDDICDTGETIIGLSKLLHEQGAKEVRSVVLVSREKSVSIPNWSGFVYSEDCWLVGYGMEDQGRFANLPAVYRKK